MKVTSKQKANGYIKLAQYFNLENTSFHGATKRNNNKRRKTFSYFNL